MDTTASSLAHYRKEYLKSKKNMVQDYNNLMERVPPSSAAKDYVKDEVGEALQQSLSAHDYRSYLDHLKRAKEILDTHIRSDPAFGRIWEGIQMVQEVERTYRKAQEHALTMALGWEQKRRPNAPGMYMRLQMRRLYMMYGIHM